MTTPFSPDVTVVIGFSGGYCELQMNFSNGKATLQERSIKDQDDQTMVPVRPIREFDSPAEAWAAAGEIVGWVKGYTNFGPITALDEPKSFNIGTLKEGFLTNEQAQQMIVLPDTDQPMNVEQLAGLYDKMTAKNKSPSPNEG